MQAALKLNGDNAELYMLLARLNMLQANMAQTASQNKVHHQNQTIENLKRALIERPSWGFAWAKLAQAYAADPKQTSSLVYALERALHFAAYEKLSQQQIIPLAIAQWDILPDSIKDQTRTTIQHALRYQPRIIALIATTAVAHNWEDELTPLLTRKWHKNVLSGTIRKKNQEGQP
ncbi:MAG: hypothetical protein GXP10_03975 [Gammaproteobacteria bacterium]|nr:hypothetical protein [Gammaproteobacteria bacterium]